MCLNNIKPSKQQKPKTQIWAWGNQEVSSNWLCFLAVENLASPKIISKMESLVSIIMVEMHICFRQQWCPKISTEVSTHAFYGWERAERKRKPGALNTCSSLGLASDTPGIVKLSIWRDLAAYIMFLFLFFKIRSVPDQGWKNKPSGF